MLALCRACQCRYGRHWRIPGEPSQPYDPLVPAVPPLELPRNNFILGHTNLTFVLADVI